jgi:hypothetical protein
MADKLVYVTDEALVDKIQSHYSLILDQVGLNVANPVAANIGFFNNTGKLFADPMRIGKTVIFFTRPNLNFFTRKNILKSKILSYYASNPLGITAMRQLMYPDIANEMYYAIYDKDTNKIPTLGRCDDSTIGDIRVEEGKHSLPLVKTNFNTLLSNTCMSTSGGKDINLDTYETTGNFQDDKLRYAGGIDNALGVGTITCTFEDLYGSPVLIDIMLWIMYMHYVSKHICDPYWAYIVHRIIDYTCSIYIFILGTDGQTIVRWVKYGGCFPLNIPFGAINHSKDAFTDDTIRTLAIEFAHNFMCPMDPTVLTEFNILNGPAIRRRLKDYYSDTDGKKTNELISYHALSLKNAARLLNEYPPVYEGSFSSHTLPMKKVEVRTADTAEPNPMYGDEHSVFLKNRANGLISSNFYGVPYITEGNKLMYV